jgi:Uma2 family endonuclease
VVMVEILSPSNERITRAHVWAYTSIPSVAEILLLSGTSIEAELWRRGPDGTWPPQPQMLGAGDAVRLDAIGFAEKLAAFYRTTSLAA